MTVIDHDPITFRMHPETERRILLAESYARSFWTHWNLCHNCMHYAILGSVYGWSSVDTSPCMDCWLILQNLPDSVGDRLDWRTDNEAMTRYRLLLDK